MVLICMQIHPNKHSLSGLAICIALCTVQTGHHFAMSREMFKSKKYGTTKTFYAVYRHVRTNAYCWLQRLNNQVSPDPLQKQSYHVGVKCLSRDQETHRDRDILSCIQIPTSELPPNIRPHRILHTLYQTVCATSS